LGRALVQRLQLRGVAKFDFKRAPDGRLYLLEVNPRFNLWHHLGALAGVNLPAMVHHDLMGQSKPETRTAVAGLRWCRAWQDVLAARHSQIKTTSWLRWTISCEAKRLLALDDPMPLVGGACWRVMDFIKKALGVLKPGSRAGHWPPAEPRASSTFAKSPPFGRG
jgi:predicted ATP-grasp superfamily ATP-dependent carboligase